jgi:hypothetical protein
VVGCATHAAIAAGHSALTTYSIGSVLPKKPHIQPASMTAYAWQAGAGELEARLSELEKSPATHHNV